VSTWSGLAAHLLKQWRGGVRMGGIVPMRPAMASRTPWICPSSTSCLPWHKQRYQAAWEVSVACAQAEEEGARVLSTINTVSTYLLRHRDVLRWPLHVSAIAIEDAARAGA
jgi:hypothetical protein